MAFICDAYHHYFEFVDISLLTNSNEKNEENNSENKPKSVNYIDQDPKHRKNWFAKVRDSKIPSDQTDKDQYLYECLKKLFDKLCDNGCLEPGKEKRDIFIYRFSGFNGQYPPDMTIRWNGKNIFFRLHCPLSVI